MSYRLDVLPNEPIFLLTLEKDYDMGKEAMTVIGDLKSLLDAANAPMTFILDVRAASMGLDDIVFGANAGTRMTGIFKHPKVLKTIVVTGSRLIELAARGMNSPIFGHVKMDISKTLEEAMARARQ